MSLFRRRQVETRSIESLPWNYGGTLGGPISAERALSLVPVYAAIGLLARTVSCTPIHGYRRLGEDERRRMALPQLFATLQEAGVLTRWLFRPVYSLAARGNAIGLITSRDGFGYPTAVTWLHPEHVTVDDQAMSGRGSFTDPVWRFNGREISNPEDIVHIPWFPVPGRVLGLSPLGAVASMVATGINAQDYASEWFANGGVPPGTFKNTARTLQAADAEAVKERLVSNIRARKPLVYGADWQYEPISIPQNEVKFVETAKLTATQVAAIYDLPPERIGGETGGPLTYSSPEQTSIHLVTFSLRNWFELLEESFAAMLPRPQYVKFNADSLIRADIMTRHNVYKTSREIGLRSIDEIRALEDLGPLPDGGGADYTPLAAKPEPADSAAPDDQPAPRLIPLRRPA